MEAIGPESTPGDPSGSEAAACRRAASLVERFDPAVQMIDHQPDWLVAASRECQRVLAVLRPWAVGVEHVGSTSVPGLVAKPIIDLQAAVRDLGSVAEHAAELEALGYTWVSDVRSPSYVLFVRPWARPRSHHLHLCESGGFDERRHLCVREYLRAHPKEARAYETLKLSLVRARPADRLAYIAGKADHVDELERCALAWAASAGIDGAT